MIFSVCSDYFHLSKTVFMFFLMHWRNTRPWCWTTLCPYIYLCSLTNMSSLRCVAVVHGQGEGRGAVAQQTDLAAAGEAHGKSCDLMDIRRSSVSAVFIVSQSALLLDITMFLTYPSTDLSFLWELEQIKSLWTWCVYYFINVNVIQLIDLLFLIWLCLYLMREGSYRQMCFTM